MDFAIPITMALGLTWVLGAALTLLGRRGRRINDHPCCPRCGYDLVGRTPLPDRCPECGAALNSTTLRHGVRERQPRLFWSGAALLTIAALASLTALRAGMTGTAWFPYAPAWALRLVLVSSPDTEHRDAIAREVTRRLPPGSQGSSADTNALADVVIAAQRQKNRPWTDAWHAAFDAVIDQPAIAPERAVTLIESAVDFSMSLRTPTGRDSPVLFTYSVRYDLGSRSEAYYRTSRLRVTDITCTPHAVLIDERRDDGRSLHPSGGPSSEEQLVRLPVGTHTLRIQFDGLVTRGVHTVPVHADRALTVEVVPYAIPDPPTPPGIRRSPLGM